MRATEARILLNLLTGRHALHGQTSASAYVACYRRGWTSADRGGVYLTAEGRDALAAWLLRDLTRYVAPMPKQPTMANDEARLLLGCLRADGYFEGAIGDDPTTYVAVRGRKWIDAGFRVTPYGREALVCWLLRGLK